MTDSTAALPPGVADRWGITTVPLDVVVDGHRHVEGVDLTPAGLVEALRRGAHVSTSQPAPEAFSRAYARLAAQGAAAVVSVHLAGQMSGTVAAAHAAAERAPLPVHVVDSGTVAMALGSAALAAAWTAAGVPPDERFVVPGGDRLAVPGAGRPEVAGRLDATGRAEPAGRPEGTRRRRAGAGPDPRRALAGRLLTLADVRHWTAALRRRDVPAGPDEVASAARAAAAEAKVWFLVDSLEHLRRGGRLSAPVAALGTVLGLRPLLTVSGGRVVVADKIRTRRAARERLEAVAVAAAGAHDRVRLVVHHLGQPDVAGDLAARLDAVLGPRVREVVVADAGAVLGAHAGPGLLAVVVVPA